MKKVTLEKPEGAFNADSGDMHREDTLEEPPQPNTYFKKRITALVSRTLKYYNYILLSTINPQSGKLWKILT